MHNLCSRLQTQDTSIISFPEREFVRISSHRKYRVRIVATLFFIIDLSGNIWEWVEDSHPATYQQAPVDGSAWLEANGSNCG
jgi:hypothetical protein